MNDHLCEQEAAVVRAARSNEWGPILRSHLDTCAVCREAANIVAAMNLLVVAEASQIPPTPDPRLVWLKASFAGRQRRHSLISRLASLAYSVLAVAIGVGVFSFIDSRSSRSDPAQSSSPFPSLLMGGDFVGPILFMICAILLLALLMSPSAKKTH